MDSNQDGVINEQEFTQAHSNRMAARAAQSRPMRNAANAPRFTDLDLNGDGVIQPQEMMQFRQQRMQARPAARPGWGGGTAPNMQRRGRGFNQPVFSAIDTNRDGCINAAELSRFQQNRSMQGPRLGKQGMGRGMGLNMPRYQDYDLNGDGNLVEEEFVEARGQRIAQRAAEGRMMRGLANMPSFADIDLDKDGKISEVEFASHQATHRRMRMQQ
jgi:Ca2+-binding EF-hand superfamily protein